MPDRRRFYDGLDADRKATLLVQIRNLWTHISTAIEGNTLTLEETAFVLSEGLTIAGKALKDHQEVVGHARAIELVYGMLDRNAIAERDLFDLHRAVLTETVTDIFSPVGAWKREPSSVSAVAPDGRQVVIEFPSPDRIPCLMNGWLDRFNRLAPETAEAATEAYALSHLEFVSIHPFYDGNGRMARLLANLPLLRAGFAPLVVPREHRLEYLRSIAAYQLSVPCFPDNDAFPGNERSATFVALCGTFHGEVLQYVEEARRRQRARDAASPPRH